LNRTALDKAHEGHGFSRATLEKLMRALAREVRLFNGLLSSYLVMTASRLSSAAEKRTEFDPQF
jgi:hypothetical protein